MKQRRHHRWTLQEEDILFANKALSPKEIKQRFFPRDASVTIQAIADKLSRVVDEREQPNTGKPWSADDENYLRQHLNDSNAVLKPRLGRGSKELDQAKFDIRHSGRINPKRRARRVFNTKNVKTPVSPQTPLPTMPIMKTSSKLTTNFRSKNGLVFFSMSLRVHKNSTGLNDLVSELRSLASTIEKNNDFVI